MTAYFMVSAVPGAAGPGSKFITESPAGGD